MNIDDKKLKNILEATLMSVGKPMSVEQLMKLFEDDERPSANRVKEALEKLQKDCEKRGIELKEVATGYRYQARQEYSVWLSRLWEERPAKYSRAYLETLALIAYRQPVTRAEIEDVRGVSVSSNIVKTMLEREWIRVVGHRDVPGRPSLYATTKQFLDYFNMKSLDELPSLAEIRDLEDLSPELELSEPGANEQTENQTSESDMSLGEHESASEAELKNNSDVTDIEASDTDLAEPEMIEPDMAETSAIETDVTEMDSLESQDVVQAYVDSEIFQENTQDEDITTSNNQTSKNELTDEDTEIFQESDDKNEPV